MLRNGMLLLQNIFWYGGGSTFRIADGDKLSLAAFDFARGDGVFQYGGERFPLSQSLFSCKKR